MLIMALTGRTIGQSLGSAKNVEEFKARFQELRLKLNTVAMRQVLHDGEFVLNAISIVLVRSREF